MALPSVIARYRLAVDAELRSMLAGYSSPLYGLLRYHLGWLDEQGNPLPGSAGKALRPSLCLLACEALAGDYRPALSAAAALELLHNASLIHDDIQDGDRRRRHRPTVWAICGRPQALDAGNAMASIASLSLQRLADAGLPAAKRLRAHRLMYEVCLSLLEGQHLDIDFEDRPDVTLAQYLAMVERKTAASIACALEMGALLATDDERAVSALRDCGRLLGLAFQIGDDLLGIYGDEATLGKPVTSDIRRSKKSFPIVYALQKTRGAARRQLLELYARSTEDDRSLATLLAILDEAGTRACARRSVERFCRSALRSVSAAGLPAWAYEGLCEVAHFLAEREA